MSRLWSNKRLYVGCMLLAFAVAIAAQSAQALKIVPITRDNQVLVSFEVPDGYTNDVRDAISSGLKTTFSYDVELRMKATMWVDRVIATSVVTVSDRYDNLTRRHSLMRTVDGREQDSTTTESETTVRQWLTSLDKLAICRTTKLEPNRDYYVGVTARVSPSHTSMLGWTRAIVGRTPFTFVQ